MHILEHVLTWHRSWEFIVYIKHNCEKHEAIKEVICSVEPCPSSRSHWNTTEETWICSGCMVQARNTSIDHQGKGLQIAVHLRVGSIVGSDGWINRFKRRHNLVYWTLAGESRNVYSETVDDWKNDQLFLAIKEWHLWHTQCWWGLFFSLHPNKSLTFCGDPCHGGVQFEDHITCDSAVKVCVIHSDGEVDQQFTRPKEGSQEEEDEE